MAVVALVLVSLLGAAPPRPSTGALLREQCLAGAADPRNPWALAHGLLVEGRTFKARDGRSAARVIVSDFLQREGSGPDANLFFAPALPDGTPIEPHPQLLLKTLLLSGHAPSEVFRASWGPLPLRSLVEDLTRDFRRETALSPHGAWTLDALSHGLAPGASFTTRDGERVRLDSLLDEALTWLEYEEAEVLAGMKAGLPQVPKSPRGLHAHPCGGLHLVQAVLSHARHPSVKAAWGARLDRQVDVLLYRLTSESRQYDAALTALPPTHRLPLLIQMMKFYGHWLETLGRYRDETGWTPSPEQLQAIRQAGALLEGTVRRLDASGAWTSRDRLKAVSPSLFLDLIGDTCHAARGWHDWRRALEDY